MIKISHIETPGKKINTAIKKTAKNAYNYTNKKLDEKFTKKQKHLVAGVGALALAGLGAAAMIGRDPARVAKTLNGSSFQTKIYKQGESALSEILQKKGSEYSVNLEDFNVFFKKDEKYDFEKAMGVLQESCNNLPKEIADALNSLQNKISNLINQRKDGFITMDGVPMDKVEDFLTSTADDTDVIRPFFEKISSDTSDNKLLNNFKILENNFGFVDGKYDASRLSAFHRKINAFELCPKDLLPKDNVYYHGTGKTRGIFKHGITPFKSNQVGKNAMMACARECGAGIYLTPDIEVAQSFAGLSGPFGRILPYKTKDVTAGIASQEGMVAFNGLVNDFISERVDDKLFDMFDFEHFNPVRLLRASNEFVKFRDKNVAINEMLSRKIVVNNGFDAMYTTKGINSLKDVEIAAHMFDINAQLGRDEKQFVVYSPEKIELQSRPIKTRIHDVKDRTFALGHFMLNAFKGLGQMYKEIFKEIKSDFTS